MSQMRATAFRSSVKSRVRQPQFVGMGRGHLLSFLACAALVQGPGVVGAGEPGPAQVQPGAKFGSEIELAVQTQGGMTNLSLGSLRSRLALERITVDDPVYHRKKTYEGF